MESRPNQESTGINAGKLAVASLTGPENLVSVSFRRGNYTCEPFGHLYIETLKVMRREIQVSGWAHCPGAFIQEIQFPEPWASRVVSLRTGIERGDIQARFGGGRDALQTGFTFSLEVPPWFWTLGFEIGFDNGCRMAVRNGDDTSRELKKRLRKNLGHRYLSWLKPAKRALRKKVRTAPKAAVRLPSLSRNCHAGSSNGEVILPVHNGSEFLEPLLSKLCRDEDITRLHLVDDAGADPEVIRLLEETARRHPKVTLTRNEAHLGLVKTINKAFQLVTDDCILLNTDVDVPAGWVGRLLEPIRRDPSVATTTPFTNSGVLLSFPESLVDNDVFKDLPVERIDEAFQRLRPVDPQPELPSGVGFCMGMSLKAIREVGLFDEAGSGRGYGEENDWCQRAIRLGYRHLPVPNLYIHHAHGGHTARERKHLLEAHSKLMGRKHPFYQRDLQVFLDRDPLRRHREVALLLVLARECAGGVGLIFDHQEGGGANAFRERRVRQVQDQGLLPLVARCDHALAAILLSVCHPRWSGEISFEELTDCLYTVRSLGLRQILINSIAFFPDPIRLLGEIRDLAAAHPEVETEVFLHDYHCICPSHNLIDHLGKYCDVPPETVCRDCLTSNPHLLNLPVPAISAWRDAWRHLFEAANRIRAFSQESADLLLRVFPDAASRVFVEPHGRHFVSSAAAPQPLNGSGKPVVGVVGNIGLAKGAAVVAGMARLGTSQIVVIGRMAPGYESIPGITVHGAYVLQDELRDLLERYRVTVCLIPSIWPETYNFVADELMMLGMPLVTFDIGAHAARIRNYELGKVVPLDLAGKPTELDREIAAFRRELAESGAKPDRVSSL